MLSFTFPAWCQGGSAPTVRITEPSSSTSFSAPGPIMLRADAYDADGEIAKVEFFVDGNLLAGSSVTSAPYSFQWKNPPLGSHSIVAKATDDADLLTSSTAVTISVVTATVPSVSLLVPATGTTFYQGTEPVILYAQAINIPTTGYAVALYDEANQLTSMTSAPYMYEWTNAPLGTHTVTAKILKDTTVISTSSTITVTV